MSKPLTRNRSVRPAKVATYRKPHHSSKSMTRLSMKIPEHIKKIEFFRYCFTIKGKADKLSKQIHDIKKRINLSTNNRQAKRLSRVLKFKQAENQAVLNLLNFKIGKYIRWQPCQSSRV